MVDAERRLLAHALQDIDNQHFVLLSDRYVLWFAFVHLYFIVYSFNSTLMCVYSCVPLHNFDYVYDYLMGTNLSFIDW